MEHSGCMVRGLGYHMGVVPIYGSGSKLVEGGFSMSEELITYLIIGGTMIVAGMTIGGWMGFAAGMAGGFLLSGALMIIYVGENSGSKRGD